MSGRSKSSSILGSHRTVAVVMTGELDDGGAGAVAVHACGGMVIAQAPSDCVAPGQHFKTRSDVSRGPSRRLGRGNRPGSFYPIAGGSRANEQTHIGLRHELPLAAGPVLRILTRSENEACRRAPNAAAFFGASAPMHRSATLRGPPPQARDGIGLPFWTGSLPRGRNRHGAFAPSINN